MKLRNTIPVSLVAILLAACMPAYRVVATKTAAPASPLTPVPTRSPIPELPTEQFIEPQLDQEIQIKLGESVTLESESLTITFRSLEGDSRCPQGVVCVWQGNAEVVLNVSKNEFSLNTTLEPREKVVGPYTIQLRDVLPYPKAGEEYAPEDYSIRIIVSKK